MSKTKKVISVVLAAALIMAMATVAMISASAATTIYFEKPDAWDAAYAYIWDGETNNGWAGVLMTEESNGLWSIDAEPGANIIFTNGTGGAGYQTADNVVPMDGTNCAYLNGQTATNGYGEVFDAIGWKTVEIQEVTTTVANVETTVADVETTVADVETTVADVETTVADVETTAAEPVETTVADVETTVADVETTVADVETTAAEPVETTAAEPVETTVAEPVETTVAEPEETTAAAEADGIVVGGEEYTANVGDVVTYTFTLKTPKAIENIQATTKYDAAKLKLVDTTVAERFPNMTGVVANAADGAVYFNASEISAGFDFTAGATLVTLQFEVLDASYSEITTTIEEMVEFFGIDYITGGEIVADGVEVAETLTVPEVEDSTPVTTTEATVATTEATVATTEAPATTKAPVADPTGTTGESGKNPDVPGTGSSIAIYAVLATLAMAAAAVVVLRKKVNG